MAKKCAVLPRDVLALIDGQRPVDAGCRLQDVSLALPVQVSAMSPQFRVDERDQPLERRAIAVPPRHEQVSDLSRLWRPPDWDDKVLRQPSP
jgi:hypothetical protein